MSKSEWKDLPDWQNPADYEFLDGATPEVWAWENLRRNPEYRTDWSIADGKTDDTVYIPSRREDESDEAWEYRILQTGIKPIKTTMAGHLGMNWWLQTLYDPNQPYSQGVRFHTTETAFPRLIAFPHEFLELIDDEELNGGAGFQRVADGIAVIAFDLTAGRTNQLKAANAIITAWQSQMEIAGRIIRSEGHAGKIDFWKRHLRVLDARRGNPAATYTKIAEVLWTDKPFAATLDDMRNAGQKYGDAARNQMRHYRKLLFFKDTTEKIKKS